MARKMKGMALYEVISKARLKSAQSKALSQIDSEKIAEEKGVSKPKTVKQWSVKTRPIRLYKDRIELCFSWQLAMITVLAFIALFLVFFRLGQLQAVKSTEKPKLITEKASKPTKSIMPDMTVNSAGSQTARTTLDSRPPKMVEPMGDNVIVIASYELSSHLEPVKDYFRKFGIETEIVSTSGRYLLVTQRGFDNPSKAGTDGFEMKKKIIAIGANYKPPAESGFESFGPKPFHDAYGMKAK